MAQQSKEDTVYQHDVESNKAETRLESKLKQVGEYHKIISQKPDLFHKKKRNFSNYIDISRNEVNESYGQNNKRELPRLWSRNCAGIKYKSKNDNVNIASFRTKDLVKESDGDNDKRSISPVERYLIQRSKDITNSSFIKRRNNSISQQRAFDQATQNLRFVTGNSVLQNQIPKNSEYDNNWALDIFLK